MTPFKCPACDGYGKRARKPGGKRKKCRACQGSCILWESVPVYRPAPYYWHNPYWYGNSTLDGVVLCNGTDGISYTGSTNTAHNVDTTTDFGAVTYTANDLSTLTDWTVS